MEIPLVQVSSTWSATIRYPQIFLISSSTMNRTVWDCLQLLKSPLDTDSNFAIIILNQPILCHPKLICTLWCRAILRVLVDGGSNQWLDFTRKRREVDLKPPDFISGDFDSIKPSTKSYFESAGVPLIPTPDQNETDFTKALKCCVDKIKKDNLKVEYFLIVCETSGRLDQVIANLNTLHRARGIVDDRPVLIVSSQNVSWLLPEGDHQILVSDEFVREQYPCGLIPLCGPTVFTTSGLKWDMNNFTSEFGGLVSTSNTFSKTAVNITCDRPVIWTTQYLKINQEQ